MHFHPTIPRLLFFVLSMLLSSSTTAQQAPGIYISSRNTHSIKRYSPQGEFLGDFVAPNSGGLTNPQALFFHPHDGSLIVTGIENTAIKRYDGQSGEFLGDFSSGYTLGRPTKMGIGPDSLLYVSQWSPAQNKVARFTLDGEFVDEFTETGVPNGCAMAWDTAGNMYVASYGNGQTGNIHRFGPEGAFLGIFINSDILQGPVGLWIDEEGHFFVVDWTIGGVLQFDADGNFLDTFITGLVRTEGNAFDEEGRIYLCDWQANLVKRFHPDGSLERTFIDTGGLLAPNSITFGPGEVANGVSPAAEPAFKFKVAPNPSADTFFFSFRLPATADTRISLWDEKGRMASLIQEGRLPGGEHTITWRAPAMLSTGTYYVKLYVEGEVVGGGKAILAR